MKNLNFCLSSESFEDISHIKEDIYNRINELDQINQKINDFKDKLFRDDSSIYYVDIFNGLRIHEFLYNPSIDAYYRQKLRIILDQHTKSYNGEEVDKYIGFHQVDDSLISTLDKLINFYFTHIGNIQDEEEFFERIKLHFPELEFHDEINNTLKTLEGSLEYFGEPIVKSLIHLRDDLRSCINETVNLYEALRQFKTKSKFVATLEGTSEPKRKKEFSFYFKKDDDTTKLICCEPHIKLEYSSVDGDTKYYYNRIHFHQGDQEVKNGKILIGSIGYHR